MRIRSIILLAALGGCSSAPTAESDQTITQTIVHFRGDQDPVVTTRVITVEEQQREVAARLARPAGTPSAGGIGEAQQAITQDPGCASSDVALYDQANFMGNELCFYGGGTADLQTYAHSCFRPPICLGWWDEVRSFSANGSPYHGRFVEGDGNTYELFFAGEVAATVSTTVASARYLTIDN